MKPFEKILYKVLFQSILGELRLWGRGLLNSNLYGHCFYALISFTHANVCSTPLIDARWNYFHYVIIHFFSLSFTTILNTPWFDQQIILLIQCFGNILVFLLLMRSANRLARWKTKKITDKILWDLVHCQVGMICSPTFQSFPFERHTCDIPVSGRNILLVFCL